MPVVPLAEPTQRLTGLPGGGLQAADFGQEQIGRAAAGLGQSVAQYAEAVDYRQKVVGQANVKRGDLEFSTFADQSLYGDGQQSTGYKGTLGSNALTARADVEKSLREKRLEILARTTDPRERTALELTLGTRLNAAMVSVGSHAQEQATIYDRELSAARLSNLTNQAVKSSDDPAQFAPLIASVATEVHDRAMKGGWPEARETMEVAKARDDVYEGVIKKLANVDPLTAQHYLDKHRDVISAKLQNDLDAQLSSHVDDATADQMARMVRGDMPGPQSVHPTALDPNRDALFMGTKLTETPGGRAGLKSPAGALGTMQVMPETAKQVCKRLGIPYDEHKLQYDAKYCDRIGREFQDGLLRKYNGNAMLTAAAYNAGDGMVDDWIHGTNRTGKNKSGLKLGDPRTGETTDAEFASRIPFAETRKYVPLVLNRAAQLSGMAPATSQTRPNNIAAQTAAIEAMDAPYNVKQKAISKLNAMDAQDQRGITDNQKRAYETALPMAMQGAKSVKDIPMTLWSAMGPEHQRTIQGVLDSNEKGHDAPPDPKLYLQAVQAAGADPGKFAHTDLTPLVGKLPKGDVERLMGIQKEYLTGGDSSPKAVAYSHISSATDDIMAAAGLTTTGLKGNASAEMAGRLVAIRHGIESDVDAYHKQVGKWPSEIDIQKFAMRRTTKVTLPGTGVLSNKTALLGEVAPGTKITLKDADVPAAERQRITDAYKRAGRALSPGDISSAYLRAGRR